MDEWDALQNLPPEQLMEYKDKIMVNFGYDKKDGPPTTYHFNVDISSIVFHFCLDEHNHVADVKGTNMNWSLKKMKDGLRCQTLTFNSICLTQTSEKEAWDGFTDLLFPLNGNKKGEAEENPQLVFRSTSRPCGDNVKLLVVRQACIYFIYPAWMFVKSFFQNLPDPDVMSQEEVLGSIQIADRWYRIDTGMLKETLQKIRRCDTERPVLKPKQDNQIRVVLESPRIVLVQDSYSFNQKGRSLTLSLNHLDFCHHNNQVEGSSQKTLFLHDLEIFTGSDDIDGFNKIQERSLLYPLCVGMGTMSKYSDGEVVESSKWISSDVVSFRAAFTDMTLAMDIFQKVLSDYDDVKNQNLSSTSKPDIVSMDGKESKCTGEVKEKIGVACGGFDLTLIDDSGRHFAGSQELVQLSISGILYNTLKTPDPNEDFRSVMRLQLHGVELVDCLQPSQSPFRIVAMGNNTDADGNDTSSLQEDKKKRWLNMNKKVFDDFMDWDTYCMRESDIWGYHLSELMHERSVIAFKSKMRIPFHSSNLVDIHHKIPLCNRHEYKCVVRKVVLQWNPSMAIALQRFLGRLRKELKVKQSASRTEADLKSVLPVEAHGQVQVRHAEIEVESITLCLNKEHQHRRLLQVTISNAFVGFQHDAFSRLTVQGSLGDLNAWDSDGNREGQVLICRENRLVVGVLHKPADLDETCPGSEHEGGESINNSRRLLTFNYYSAPSEATRSEEMQRSFEELNLPDWVVSQVGKMATVKSVDDCLSLSVATVRFNHIRERTGEIMDYLSNGLPGKGMGATSRAAKGFITKRIKTRSFTNLNVNSPQLFLPCNRGNEEGVIICLGDVGLRSWFDEATLVETKNIDCNDLVRTRIPVHNQVPMTPRPSTDKNIQNTYWWRILSVSILGLGWRVHRREADLIPAFLQIENPLNFHLQIWRPPSHTELPIILRCKMTPIETILTYNEYILFNTVLKENLTKKIDKSLWDNPEDMSVYDEENLNGGVKYSKNARFVRFGGMSGRYTENSPERSPNSKNETPNTTSFDAKFSLDGIVLILHRDDRVALFEEDGNYDIVRLEVEDIDLHVASSADGSRIGTAKLQSFALIDVGDVGRISREKFQIDSLTGHEYSSSLSKIRKPSLFSVIVEGYDTQNNVETSRSQNLEKDPQLIITFDTGSSSVIDMEPQHYQGSTKKVTSIRVTLNHLNLNPLIRPLNEIADFISAAWPVEKTGIDSKVENRTLAKNTECSGFIETTKPEEHQPNAPKSVSNKAGSTRAFHLTVITNYPRVFLVPDETDPFTKALVLRGLTVLNATVVNQFGSDASGHSTTVSIQGQIHSLESYINPDPRSALETSVIRHLSFTQDIIEEKEMDPCSTPNDILGVALIEPVTASFTFFQMKKSNFPTIREIFVSMEPVSTTLSFEDMHLIEIVLSRWKNQRDLARLRTAKSSDPLGNVSTELETPTFVNSGDEGDSEDNDSRSTPEIIPRKDSFGYRIETVVSSSDSQRAEHNLSFCGDCIPANNFCMSGSTPDEYEDEIYLQPKESPIYEVIFSGKKLGLALRKKESSVVVEDVLDTTIRNQVTNGDVLISIENVLLSGMSFKSVLNLIKNTKRPMKIKFQRVQELRHLPEEPITPPSRQVAVLTEEDEMYFSREVKINETNFDLNLSQPQSEEMDQGPGKLRRSYMVTLARGVESGLEIEKSLCGDVAIVSKVTRATFVECCVDKPAFKYMPKAGTIIIAINGEPALTKGFEGTSEFLNTCENEISGEEETFTLTFLDANSDDWGVVDKLDIVIAGIKLTLIDDINGRDMPLLQGILQSMALKMERGLGRDCDFIRVDPPSILKAEKALVLHRNLPSICDVPVTSDLTEVITKVCANVEVQLDYYNARIAVWEPLVESSCLSTEFESQRGNNSIFHTRPGAFSIAISDYEGNSNVDSVKQPYVCINLSDSAADLLFTAFYEWKTWRKNEVKGTELNTSREYVRYSNEKTGVGIPHLPRSGYATKSPAQGNAHHTLSPETEWQLGDESTHAQSAAQAALIFARRRGAESQKSQDSKPFIFRNHTGMTISFLPEVQGAKEIERSGNFVPNLAHKQQPARGLGITTIQDGKEANFDLDTTENYKSLNSSHGNTNKVRSYDGQFPLLSVTFHTETKGVFVEILQHMSVVRIGETMKSLRVKTPECQDEFNEASILVVWSVALENNRRIITLSSAVRVTSPRCGVPIEVGVKYMGEKMEGLTPNHHEIASVGTSSSSTVCYLPLSLQLNFKTVEVFVRPYSTSTSFNWSNNSILRFEKSLTTSQHKTNALWSWTLFDHSTSISCEPVSSSHGCSKVYLSYECHYESPSLSTQISEDFYLDECPEYEYQMKCIDICPVLSLRNVLPISLEWEIVSGDILDNPVPLDGSLFREGNCPLELSRDGSSNLEPFLISPGYGVDVFACDLATMNLGIRVRCDKESEWSGCVPINYVVSENGLLRLPLKAPDEKAEDTEDRQNGKETHVIFESEDKSVGNSLTHASFHRCMPLCGKNS